MKFNKCIRCGCFFSTEDSLCPNCQTKDAIDKVNLRNFVSNNDIPSNVENLALYSGIELKNVNRYLQTEEFSDLKKNLNSGINISL